LSKFILLINKLNVCCVICIVALDNTNAFMSRVGDE